MAIFSAPLHNSPIVKTLTYRLVLCFELNHFKTLSFGLRFINTLNTSVSIRYFSMLIKYAHTTIPVNLPRTNYRFKILIILKNAWRAQEVFRKTLLLCMRTSVIFHVDDGGNFLAIFGNKLRLASLNFSNNLAKPLFRSLQLP